MEVVLAAVLSLLLSTVARLLAFSHCVSKAGYTNLDSQCQVYCADGRCPDYCKCVAGNASETCAKLDFGSNNSVAINETVKPGTPIFTIQIAGQERWTYTLVRDGPVDGSVWNSLSKYLKLTRIGNRYEMIVDVTPDLESIYQLYGIKLTRLTLRLTCERDGFPKKDSTVVLQILPVNEYAPEFFITPLNTKVPENTKVGTEVYRLSDHTLDLDVNPTSNELSSFAMWQYLADKKTDGRAYFQMSDTQTGGIEVKAELDFELLLPLGAVRLYLRVSATDVHGRTSFTTLTVDIQDMDDLPPGFYDASCGASQMRCVTSYQAKVPLRFQGQIVDIIPGAIQARDMDELNTPIIYSLKPAQNETLENVNKFYINETTGSLSLISPFEKSGEVDLVIEAREISQNARASQIPLHITIGDFRDTPGVRKLDFRPGSNDTNLITRFSEDPFMIATIAQSVLILLLLLTSLILCAKLKTRSRTAAVARPPRASDKPCDALNTHFSKDLERQVPPTFAVTAASTSSTGGVTKGENCADANIVGLSNDRNKQNCISEIPSAIPFAPRTNNNWIKTCPFERNMKLAASPVSSMELERTISLTVSDPTTLGNIGTLAFSDCPSAGCSQCGRVAYPNHANTMRTNILAMTNSTYTGKLLIVSDPSIIKHNYTRSVVSCNPELLYEKRKACVSGHHSETESTNSDKVKYLKNRNIISQASNIRMSQGEQSGTDVIDKKSNNIAREPGFSRNRLPLSAAQNKKNVRESSDDCRPADKESDDGYKNENSMSDDNTVSGSERKLTTGLCSQTMSITPRQSYRDASSPMEVSARSRGVSRVTQSSLSLAVQQIHNTPLPHVETTAIMASAQHEAGLTENFNNFDDQKDTKFVANSPNTNAEHKMIQCCLEETPQSQSITISCTTQALKNNAESKEHHPHTAASTPSLFVTGTMMTSKLQSDLCNETKSEIVKDMKSVIVSRPAVSSLSSNKSKSKLSSRETNCIEHSSEVVAASNSFPGESIVACTSRPHTGDATMFTNKSFSSTVIPRPSSSAPSRRKRRTKRKGELAEVNFHRSDHTDKYTSERLADVSQSSCNPNKCNGDSSNVDFQQRHSWSLSNIPHQHQPKLLQVENHLLPCDHANYWSPEYQQVYLGNLQKDQHYILLRQQETPQCGLRVQQHQHLPPVPEVLNLHLHHPDDRVVATQDRNNKCEDEAKLQRLGKKDRNKRLQEPE